MKKWLSRLISTAAAAAITASACGVSAAAAPTPFSDVTEDSKYIQAFNELYALNILIGYEDGTVLPDNLITRAEVTKLVVAMMGPSYLQQAESKSYTDFTDVPYDEWYSGYVSVGVANGFIAGNGDGTFTPDANVTYEQIVKMIVAAMGYGPICEKRGGWPNGYLSVAAEIGVTNGVSANNAQAVTRAQVAQLIDNGIKLPIVSVTGYSESELTGQLVAQTKIMDDITSGGDASDYQTLLIKNHDTYSVKGRINATRRSDSSLKADEVRFSVESTKNFDDRAYGSGYLSPETIRMTYNGTDAQEIMFSYVDALIREDEDGEYTILTLTPYGSDDTVTYDASLYESYETTSGYVSSIDVYTSSDSSKTKTYKMASGGAEVYVNGVADGTLTSGKIEQYIAHNDNGKITFIDQTEPGKTTTDGKIDTVVVTFYDDAIVDSVITQSSQYKIYFKNNSQNIRTASMSIDPEDDDITVSYHMAGLEIPYTDIEEDDVLSIAYDVTGSFKDSEFYDVYVSRSVVTGKVTASNTNSNDEFYYTIGGVDYTLSYSIFGGATDVLTVGSNYEVYLNHFGNIAYVDEDSSSKVIGVVDYASVDSSDTPKIRIITTAGTKVSYTVKDSSKTLYNTIASRFFSTVNTDASTACTGKNDIQYRVAEYVINANGYITNATPLYTVGKSVPTATDAEYKASTNKLGSYALNDSTIIIDLTDNSSLNDISKISVGYPSQLTDGATYSAFLYEKSTSDSTYRYMLLTGGSATYNANTNIAVYSKGGTVYDDIQGTQVATLMVYEGGSDTLKTLRLDTGMSTYYMHTLASSSVYQEKGGAQTLSASEYDALADVGFYSSADGTITLEEYTLLSPESYYVDTNGNHITAEEYNSLADEGYYINEAAPGAEPVSKYYRISDNTEITAELYNAMPQNSYYQSGSVTIAPADYDKLDSYGYYVNAANSVITVEDYDKLGAGETKYVSKTTGAGITEEQYYALQDKSDYIGADGSTISVESYSLLPPQSGYKGSEGIISAESYSLLPPATTYKSENGSVISPDDYAALPKTSGYANASGKVLTETEYNALPSVSGYINDENKLISEAEYNKLASVSAYADSNGNFITESKYNALPSKSGYYNGSNSITAEYYNKLEAVSYYQLSLGASSVTDAAAAILGTNTAAKITVAQYNALPARSGYKDASGNIISLTAYDRLTDTEKAQYTYVTGQDAYTLVEGKDAYTYTAGKDAYTYQEGKDAYRYVEGKDAYTYTEGRDIYTKSEGQDAYVYVAGQDAYTYREGKDAYSVVEIAGQQSEYSYVPGKADYTYVDGQDAYTVETGDVNTVSTYVQGKNDYTFVAGQDQYSYVLGKADYELVTMSPSRGTFNPDTDIKETTVSSLSRGDIFVYDTDSDGYVTEVMVLFNSIKSSYSEFKKTALNTNYYNEFDSNNKLFSVLVHPVADWLETTSATKTGKVDMIFGPVLDKNNRSITIGVMEDFGSYIGCNEDIAQDYSVTSNANIYVYDYTVTKESERLYTGTSGNIQKTNVPSSVKKTGPSGENTIIDLEEIGTVNFIVAKTVDDDITEALVIIGDE